MTTVKWKMTNGNCALARRLSALIVKLHRLHHTSDRLCDLLSVAPLAELLSLVLGDHRRSKRRGGHERYRAAVADSLPQARRESRSRLQTPSAFFRVR